jgi:hypothetical protein
MDTFKQGIRSSVILLSLALVWSCSKGKETDSTPERGQAASAENSKDDSPAADGSTPAQSDQAKPGTPATPTYTISELVSKLTWAAEIANNANQKVFSGFDGTNTYKILVDVAVYGELPASITLSDTQELELYDSPEYLKAAEGEAAKINFVADATLVSMKLVETYAEGKLYELTTLKAGNGTAKVSWGATEIPLAIQVTAYTAAQVTAGKQRYDAAVAGATPSPACATCHRAAQGVDHSPYYMSQYTDAALLSTIETGLNTDDQYQTKTPHKMTFATAAAKAGIVPYLRSLDPNLLPAEQK